MSARSERGAVSGPIAVRGLILLEVALAVVVFALAAAVIYAVMREGGASQEAARRRERLVDLARSAMAMIESGAASAESLAGPVGSWPMTLSDAGPANERASGPAYELTIRTQPWGTGSLVLVEVEARYAEASGGVSAAGMTYTLRQVVRMGWGSRAARRSGGGP